MFVFFLQNEFLNHPSAAPAELRALYAFVHRPWNFAVRLESVQSLGAPLASHNTNSQNSNDLCSVKTYYYSKIR